MDRGDATALCRFLPGAAVSDDAGDVTCGHCRRKLDHTEPRMIRHDVIVRLAAFVDEAEGMRCTQGRWPSPCEADDHDEGRALLAILRRD